MSGDYSGVPDSVRFGAGETTRTFTIATVDGPDDHDKTLTLGFGDLPPRVELGTPPATLVTILDEPPLVTVSYERDSYTVRAGDDVAVTVLLSEPPGRVVVVPITQMPGDGLTSKDYSGVPDSVTFGAGETTRTFTIATVDGPDDHDKTLTLGFGDLPPRVELGTPPTALVTILDEPPPVTVSYRADCFIVEAGDDVAVTVVLSEPPGRVVVVPITERRGGGLTSGDYSGVPDSVRFGAGETTRTFTISTVDGPDDRDKTVTLGFGDLPPLVTLGTPSTSLLMIMDSPPPVTLSYENDSYSVQAGDEVTVTVVLSEPPGHVVVVPITETPGDGLTSEDYSGVPDSVTFEATETKRTFTVATTDGPDDHDKTLTLGFGDLPPNANPGTPPATLITIIDNPPTVTVSYKDGDYLAVEGGDGAVVTVMLSEDPGRTLEIPLTHVPGANTTHG